MAPSVDIRIIIPHRWASYGVVEPDVAGGEFIKPLYCAFSGQNHFHFYPSILSELIGFGADLIHIDEEPYSLVTFQIACLATHLGIPYLVFSWQNIHKRYPLPFRAMESYVLNNAAGFVGGNRECINVFRRKGYAGLAEVIPQFGVDLISLDRIQRLHETKPLRIGFLGRFVAEKGIDTVLRALSDLPTAELELVGTGPAMEDWKQAASNLGVSNRMHFLPPVASTEIWPLIRSWDVLVLPSLTRANWKEQFGRVLIEAMAVGTCVLGSSSGEIPNVIGDAGLVFAEGDAVDCARQLRRLEDPRLRTLLASRGLERVRQNYTQEKIVEQTLAFYRQVLSTSTEPLPCCV